MIRFLPFALLLLAVSAGFAAPVPGNSSDWVTLKGALIWPVKEEIPERRDLSQPRMPDREYTLKAGPLLDDTLLVHKKNRGVKNVVVFLRPDSNDRDAKFPADKIHPDLVKPKPTTHRIEMEYCRYNTRVLAIRAGDKLEVVNKGAVAENFNLQGTAVDLNVTLKPDSKPVVTDAIPAENRWAIFKCDIHPWMQGRLRVFDHPYFAVTDENGEFEIKQVPKGKWRIVYQHDLGFHWGYDGRLGFPVEIKDEGKGVMRMKLMEYQAVTRP
jgi:hypothetical protein